MEEHFTGQELLRLGVDDVRLGEAFRERFFVDLAAACPSRAPAVADERRV